MAGLCGITILILTEQERETEMMELLGLAVLLIAGKLIYSNSQNAFINRAVRKACVLKGTLLNTYENGGRSYGTYEYEADGCQYRLDVEYSWDFYRENPPLHMGIYYKDGNPEQACVRERSVKKERGQNMKRHALFMAVVCVVVLMLAW